MPNSKESFLFIYKYWTKPKTIAKNKYSSLFFRDISDQIESF